MSLSYMLNNNIMLNLLSITLFYYFKIILLLKCIILKSILAFFVFCNAFKIVYHVHFFLQKCGSTFYEVSLFLFNLYLSR